MDIYDYLSITRGFFELIPDNSNRFSQYIDFVRSSMKDYEINVLFIRSQYGKTEIVSISNEKYMIIDRQNDLYMNALAFIEIFKENDAAFIDNLFNILVFISSSELHYRQRPLLALKLYNLYKSKYNLTVPLDIIAEMGRLHFILYHEWGHYIADDHANVLETVTASVEGIFDDHIKDVLRNIDGENNFLKNFYYNVTYREIFEKNNLNECVADFLALEAMFIIMDSDQLMTISLGGKSNFVFNILIGIYYLFIIKNIKNIVNDAINGFEYKEMDSSIIEQRLRVTRQIFSRMLYDHIGSKGSKENFYRFTSFVNKYNNILRHELYPQLHRLIYANRSTFDEHIDFEINIEKCLKVFNWVWT